ncbi:MAG: alanine/glycine:cation symporter family protein [Pseudomonadota bacterium]
MEVIVTINQYLWDYILLTLLLGTGLFYTVKLKAIQLRLFPQIISNVINSAIYKDKSDSDGISSFQALTTAIAAQVGTGNLAGTATAIVAGGPGAIFWMWFSAFFGMSTIFAESILAQKFRTKIGDETVGGPAYYIDKGLGNKKLAIFFAICIILALGFIGNMVQANSIGFAFSVAFDSTRWVIGIIVAILVGLVIQGGITRIASFTEKIVPIMAVIYIFGCIYIIIIRYEYVLPAFKSIFESAFRFESAAGGVAGITIREAMRYGVARGLFSNEAGMGSTPHAHAAAKVSNPCKQGEVAIFSVFFDTFIILTLTALVILTSNFYLEMIQLPQQEWTDSIALTQLAFMSNFGHNGKYFIAIILFFFALSTIISWYYFAAINVKYLFGLRAIKPFRVLVVLCVFFGTLVKVNLIWKLADTFNGLMCIPNLIALLTLSGIVVKAMNNRDK